MNELNRQNHPFVHWHFFFYFSFFFQELYVATNQRLLKKNHQCLGSHCRCKSNIEIILNTKTHTIIRLYEIEQTSNAKDNHFSQQRNLFGMFFFLLLLRFFWYFVIGMRYEMLTASSHCDCFILPRTVFVLHFHVGLSLVMVVSYFDVNSVVCPAQGFQKKKHSLYICMWAQKCRTFPSFVPRKTNAPKKMYTRKREKRKEKIKGISISETKNTYYVYAFFVIYRSIRVFFLLFFLL